MNGPDYQNFFIAAAALFPILVLTKTVSLRARRTGSPPRGLSQVGHVVHVLAATAGEFIAVFGVWGKTKGVDAALAVLALLLLAAIPLVAELLFDARRA